MKVQAEQVTGEQVVPQNSRTGRLLRFRFNPPALGPLPARPGGFAARLATSPPDLVTHLGMVRSNAYHAAGCPVELCDHAAARDLWAVIYREAIAADGERRTEDGAAVDSAAVSGRRGAPPSERMPDAGRR